MIGTKSNRQFTYMYAGSHSPVSRSPQTPPTTADGNSRPPSSLYSHAPSSNSAYSHTGDMAERHALERLLRTILDRLVRHMSAVNDLVQQGDLSLLFGAISRPCPSHNKMWKKAAADCLIAVCRYECETCK